MVAPVAAETGAGAAALAPAPAAVGSAGAVGPAPLLLPQESTGWIVLLPAGELLLPLGDICWALLPAARAAAGAALGAFPVCCWAGANSAPAEGCWAREALSGGVTGTMRTCSQAALSAVQASIPCRQAVMRAATMQARQPSASSQPPGHDNEQVMRDVVQQASAQQLSCRR